MYRPPPCVTNFDHYGPPSLLSPTTYHCEEGSTKESIALQFPHSSTSLYCPQDYVAVSAVVVYIGTIFVNERTERIPMVARVSIVDYRGCVILDTYIHPTHHIEDYRTSETGLQYAYLATAPPFQDVQLQVADIIKNKVLVGHSLWKFLSVLGLSHPALRTRDLALFRPLRKKLKSRHIVDLPILVHLFMGRQIGFEYENPTEVACACMDLFRCCDHVFEQIIVDGAWPCNLPPTAYAEYYS